uniref:Hypothetical plant O-methyltransferase n=1 Tax=Anthriscus sylvestris TaxID=48027 RepID=A0A024FQY7_9APIA|nr:hypothetical plant O-methyltransferase [Anthriscus sylvestris]
MASHDDQEAFLKAMAIVSAPTVQGVLTTLCELKVFDIMMQKVGLDGYLTPNEIATNLAAKNPDASNMLDRMLCLLASHSIIKCKSEKDLTRSFGLTSISKYYVQDQNEHSLAPAHLFTYHKAVQLSWFCLKDAILEGGVAFTKAHGGISVFEYLEEDKKLGELFIQAMTKSVDPITRLLHKYKGFEGMKEVVDVGGAHGAALSCIVSEYPYIKGINFDLPHVVQNAPALLGVTHIGGDMFESVPGGEAILLQRLLHDWNNEESVKILKKCHEALPDSGKVVIMEMILAELTGNEDAIAQNKFQMDIGMLILCQGGKERSAKEFQKLAVEAGFAGAALVCEDGLYGVVECYKNM